MNRCKSLFLIMLALAGLVMSVQPLFAAPQVQALLPLGRMAYQTNEVIDISVVRSDTQALPASQLLVAVAGTEGSQLNFTFPVNAVPMVGNDARTTEHLHLNGLLRPGHYTAQITVNDAPQAKLEFDIYSHVRKTSFKLIDWGSHAAGADLAKLGEDGMGFNLIYGDYRNTRTITNGAATLRGGADYMQVCTMSGAHQMDVRSECDWSDPYVIRGGTARVALQAFLDRTLPNTLGVHFYDEPGLTWAKHAKTGEVTPHNVPSQDRSFKSAYGEDPLQYCDVKPDDAAAVKKWDFWGRWKESFMEAAWKDARFGVEQVNPNLIAATQSVYGFTAYTDGYYFNVVRSLPVISGHGGYDDGVATYFYPSYHHEFGRMRDLNKPNWYLPTWYRSNPNVFRLEQYLSFMMGLQGMAKPPDMQVQNPAGTPEADGIVESNKLMGTLGTIFTTMPVTRGDVALLYSLSQCLDSQVKSGMKDNYEGGGHTRARLMQAYLAGKMLHIPFFPIVEEDVVDGTLAANHKAVVLAGINALDLKVISALEAYIAGGGMVLLTDDCEVQIKGAQKVGVAASMKQYELMIKLWVDGNQAESARQRAAGHFMKEAEPLAKALQVQLAKIGVKPVLDCDNTSVAISRQAQGDIEYLFAVNAAWDEKTGGPLDIKPTTATLNFTADGRPIYDAVRTGAVAELASVAASINTTTKSGTATKSSATTKSGAATKASTAPKAGAATNAGTVTKALFRFGPGEMRVFARTARPIGGVQVITPVLFRDYTVENDPLHVSITATLVDAKNMVLAGAAPMRIRVIDPLNTTRYDLYRATEQGALKFSLPLAVNDPAGKWTVEVQEMLSNKTGTASFTFTAAAQCGALMGATERAVYFGNDRENIFRFFRTHQDVTIVKGQSPFTAAAADRLAESLKPWGVRCTIVNAADVNKPRELSAEEAATWIGIEVGRAEVGTTNRPQKVGFAINGAAILLGNKADNPLIFTISEMGFLPYAATPDFPGRGRGMITWQRDAIGIGQESITLIAFDDAGMSEAVGTMYEAAAGLDPLTKWNLPDTAAITAATKSLQAPAAPVAWQVALPDRAVDMQQVNVPQVNGTQALLTTQDGSQSLVFADGAVMIATGNILSQAVSTGKETPKPVAAVTVVPDAMKTKLWADKVVKRVVTIGTSTAVAYWGGAMQVFAADGTLKYQQMLPQDTAGMVALGNTLVVGLADGRVMALTIK